MYPSQNDASRKEVKYFLEYPDKPQIKRFPKSGRTFMLHCTTRRKEE